MLSETWELAHLWEVFIVKNVVLLNQLRYFPLLAGITVGLAQYIPEMVKKRLKLTLHLPLSENRILFVMLGYGLSTLFILFLIPYFLFLSGLSFHFPEEIGMGMVRDHFTANPGRICPPTC